MINEKSDSKPTANVADAPLDSNIIQADTDTRIITDATDSSDVTIILVFALNLMGNHLDAKDNTTAALMALIQP